MIVHRPDHPQQPLVTSWMPAPSRQTSLAKLSGWQLGSLSKKSPVPPLHSGRNSSSAGRWSGLFCMVGLSWDLPLSSLPPHSPAPGQCICHLRTFQGEEEGCSSCPKHWWESNLPCLVAKLSQSRARSKLTFPLQRLEARLVLSLWQQHTTLCVLLSRRSPDTAGFALLPHGCLLGVHPWHPPYLQTPEGFVCHVLECHGCWSGQVFQLLGGNSGWKMFYCTLWSSLHNVPGSVSITGPFN